MSKYYQRTLPQLVGEQHDQLVNSAELEWVIKLNLKGLSYGR